jgi:hypothetical protein
LRSRIGAGEGNRTLVFSLEGFRRSIVVKGRSDKSRRNNHLRTNDFLLVSERIVERDDGMFELWPHGEGPFPTIAFAETICCSMTRHEGLWGRG